MSEERFTLYYHPFSFYSQKVMLVMHEKGVSYKEKIVDIRNKGENREEWFMKMNPAGLVPVLQDGDKIVTESNDIINYLERVCSSGPTVLPDSSTQIGKDVARIDKLLDDISAPIVTFGVLNHEDLSVTGLPTIPGYPTDSAGRQAIFDKRVKAWTDEAEKYPHLREAYMEKARKTSQLYEDIKQKEKVTAELTNMDRVFDELETQLSKAEEADTWMCGPQFTMADINMAVWLLRLNFLGILTRFVEQEKHPLLYAYHRRLSDRPSVQVIAAGYSSVVGKA